MTELSFDVQLQILAADRFCRVVSGAGGKEFSQNAVDCERVTGVDPEG